MIFLFKKLKSSYHCCCCSAAQSWTAWFKNLMDRSTPGFPSLGFSSKNTGVCCHFLLQCMKVKSESEVAQSSLTLHDLMDCSTPDLPVHHRLPEFTQTHVHWVGDAIQPSHSLSSPSTPALNLSQPQVRASSLVAKVSELQLQHQDPGWSFD